jgi:3-oxoacyl-[acyl-carrier protein] reductase
MTLKDKIAIVTGAGQGIGLGIAKKLAQEGCNVVVADLNEESANLAAKELTALGVKTLAVKCDVSSKPDVDSMAAKVKQTFGSVDILVNNAGIYPFKAFAEMTEADWDKILNINLKGNYMVTQATLGLLKDSGKIISISSVASMLGMSGLSAYCASKAGINGLTRALAIELAPRKITVNAIAPGAVNTPGAAAPDEVKQQTLAAIPLKRMGEPEDIANLVAFLASDEASYITGQVIAVDGGWSAQ